MNPTEFEGTLSYMETPGTVSSHWVIARAGLKARVVPDNQQAWHAGSDNDNSVGIELEQGAEQDGFTPEQIAALVDVCKGYRDDFGVPVYHVHDSGSGGFVGHQETEQGRRNGKSDPGALFPWDAFIAALVPEPAPVPVPQPYVTYTKVGFSDGTEWYVAAVPPPSL
jgi:N-acetyl-anhydromuramyl-L-alanine amidase AmpD